jgi:hypothetical protein
VQLRDTKVCDDGSGSEAGLGAAGLAFRRRVVQVCCRGLVWAMPVQCAAEKELAAQAAGTCVASPSGPKNPQAESH